MQKLLKDYLIEVRRRQKKRRRAGIAVALIAIMVVGGVVWSLAQAGIAMTGEPKCGLEEHQHSEACYTDAIVCGMEESAGHIHTEECYQTPEPTLICGQEESEEHTHTEECYQTGEPVLICGQEESEGHTHTDACHEQQLTCGMEEHTHTDECFIDRTADVEDVSVWDAQYADTEWKEGWGENLVIAAGKQVGYRESEKNYTAAEDGSHKGYTRYGQYAVNAGMEGADVYADWDAAFVNFCIHYAGLEKYNAFPLQAGTARWYEEFAKGNNGSNAEYLAAAEGYEPEAGDIVFFEKENQETAIQMGIVSSYNKERNEIKVIQGNSDNEVKENTYQLENDNRITAYLKIIELEKRYKAAEETPEDVQETERFTQSAETENCIVTVSYGSDASIPEGAELQVVEYSSDSEKYQEKAEELGYDPEWVMDIGFFVNGEEVEPQAQVSVAVQGKHVEENEDYDITHFGAEGTEQLEGTGRKDEDGNVVIEFTTGSFSTYTIRKKPGGTETYEVEGETSGTGTVTYSTLGDDLTHVNSSGDYVGRNDWQIVDKGYEGNKIEKNESGGVVKNPKEASGDAPVRVQKNVVPTDTENEFLVYLSIDTKELYEKFFELTKNKATTSNNYHSEDVGNIVDAMTGNKNVDVVMGNKYGKKALFTIHDSEGNIILENQTYSWSQGNNVTFYLEAGGKYILMGVEVSANSTNHVRLSPEAEEAIRKEVLSQVKLDHVVDEMGSYIQYLGLVDCDGNVTYMDKDGKETTENADIRKVKWIPEVKSNPQEESTNITNNKKETWALNVAELVYKVRLDVTKEGFHSCADNMRSGVGDDESYEVNMGAILTYTDMDGKTQMTIFPKPYVRGLLYNIEFTKKGRNNENDTEGWLLPGATFTLVETDENGDPLKDASGDPIPVRDASGDPIQATSRGETSGDAIGSTPDEDKGIVRFEDLPWGTYAIVESETPDGYQKADPIKNVILCYTTNRDLVEQDEKKETNEIYKGPINVTDNTNVIWNLAQRDLNFQKIWEDTDDALEKRPGMISVTLKAEVLKEPADSNAPYEDVTDDYWDPYDGNVVSGDVVTDSSGDAWVVVSGDDWNCKWENLPTKTNEGKDIIWSVVERDIPYYTEAYSGYEVYGEYYESENDASEDVGSETDSNGGENKVPKKIYYIVNKLQENWEIVKKSSSDGKPVLKGATFTLTQQDAPLGANPITINGNSLENGVIKWGDGVEKLNGRYILEEKGAPSGYSLSTVSWIIEFKNGYPVSINNGTGKVSCDDTRIDSQTGIKTYIYTFENEPLYALPETGGSGIYLYMFSGILLMAGAALMTYKNKKRCRGVLRS